MSTQQPAAVRRRQRRRTAIAGTAFVAWTTLVVVVDSFTPSSFSTRKLSLQATTPSSSFESDASFQRLLDSVLTHTPTTTDATAVSLPDVQLLLRELQEKLVASLPHVDGWDAGLDPQQLLDSLSTTWQQQQLPNTNDVDVQSLLAPLEALLAQLQQLSEQLSSSSMDSLTMDSLPSALPPILLLVFQSLQTLAAANPVATVITASVAMVASTVLVNGGGDTPPPSQPYPNNRYDANAAAAYFARRPLQVLARTLSILVPALSFGLNVLQDRLNNNDENDTLRGTQLAELLVSLGPTFIKVGQSLSIRTDLLSPGYIQGLTTLQDQVPPFRGARDLVEQAWGSSLLQSVMVDDWDAPIAAASLGQVYKGTLVGTNTPVAIKVQRPDMAEQIALDMHILRSAGSVLKQVFRWINTDLVGTVDAWGKGFVDELDYLQEANNAAQFATQIADSPLANVVFTPAGVPEYTTPTVLVTEWVDGQRLDESRSEDVTQLCSIAMNTYLTMLLEFGTLHCDPHPGNLLRTPDGRLCILDFGMVTEIDRNLQLTLIEHMAHLTSADYAEIPRDLLLLGFIPPEQADKIEDSGVVEVLADIYGAWTSGGGAAAVNVNEVVAQMQELTAEKGNLFRIPPYFAYIAKSFSVLEGIGLQNNPKYSIVNECLPYVSKRLLTDHEKLGPALTTFVFGPDKTNDDRVVDYKRVKQLVEGFGEYTTSASGALLGKDDLSRTQLLETASDDFLDLVFAEEETPLQAIFLEQAAKIVSSGSKTLFAELRERSGILPTGRTFLGTVVDPVGFWRTSPLVTPSELDRRTVETTEKLVDLVKRQIEKSPNPAFDVSDLSQNERIELASMLLRKFWSRRRDVLATSTRFARAILHRTTVTLEQGERIPLPERPVVEESTSVAPSPATVQPASTQESSRLASARNLLRQLESKRNDAPSATLISNERRTL